MADRAEQLTDDRQRRAGASRRDRSARWQPPSHPWCPSPTATGCRSRGAGKCLLRPSRQRPNGARASRHAPGPGAGAASSAASRSGESPPATNPPARLAASAAPHGLQPLPGVARRLRERAQRQPGGARPRVRERVEDAVLGLVSSHSGSSVNGSTPSASSSSLAHPGPAPRRCPCRCGRRRSARRTTTAAPQTLKIPVACRAGQRDARTPPRSRPSTSCTGASGAPGREHLAAARDALDPPREAVRRVVRPGDDPGAQDQRAAGERALDRLLAGDLARAVELGAGGVVLVARGRRSSAPSSSMPARRRRGRRPTRSR